MTAKPSYSFLALCLGSESGKNLGIRYCVAVLRERAVLGVGYTISKNMIYQQPYATML